MNDADPLLLLWVSAQSDTHTNRRRHKVQWRGIAYDLLDDLNDDASISCPISCDLIVAASSAGDIFFSWSLVVFFHPI